MAQRYRKRPVEVEAMQMNGQTLVIVDWLAANGAVYDTWTHPTDSSKDCIFIETLEGRMCAWPGWWIIRGVKGEFYPCADDVFQKTYEAVGERPIQRVPQ